jgi:hypothetical protein
MVMTGKATGRWIRIARWAARAIALVVTALFAFFMIESGARLVPALSWTEPQGMPLFVVLLVAVAGLLLAWRREAVGGLMAVAGALVILALVYLGSGPTMLLGALFFTLPLLAAGCLFLGCWRSESELDQRQA